MRSGKAPLWAAVCAAALAALCLLALCVGRYPVSPGQVLAALFPRLAPGAEISRTMKNVVVNIRLPRVLLAVLAGAGLSCAGAALQALFANPLAAPDTLGVATGASFGAALGILLGLKLPGVQLLALASGLAAVGAAWLVGRRGTLSLVLGGMAVSALFSALVSLVKYVADPQDVLPAITYWLMGGLSGANRAALALGAPPILVGMAALFMLRWRLNALALSEEEARSLGLNVKPARAAVVLASAMIAASVVSMCGLIGWVGLLVPHAARLIFGGDNRQVIPASMALGAVFLLAMDTLSRLIGAGEVPISILTAIVGAPVFLALLRGKGGLMG